MLDSTARFLSDLQRAQDLSGVWVALSDLSLALGFDRALLAALPSRPGTPDPTLAERRTSFPEAELDEYLGSGLVQEDPLFQRTVRSERPVALHFGELSRSLGRGPAKGLLDLGMVRDCPLRMTLPAVMSADGTRWGFAVGAAIPERDVPGVLQETVPVLWLAGAAAAHRLAALKDRGGEEKCPLTLRERECLLRLAAGHRVDRIAESLGLSNATVELHLANARRHLHAKTSVEAVAKAILRGWIVP